MPVSFNFIFILRGNKYTFRNSLSKDEIQASKTSETIFSQYDIIRIERRSTKKLVPGQRQSVLPAVSVPSTINLLSVIFYGGYAEGVHLFPFRTEKLSPSWPMVLHNNAGE